MDSELSITEEEKELGVKFNLDPIFNPESMVVIGVSTRHYLNPGTIIFLKNSFETKIGERTYAVNPKGGFLESRPLYPRVGHLPETPDVAVIAVGPMDAVDALKECVDLGVKGVIVISGGFAETGAEGKRIQDEMRKICLDTATPLIGPNCVGIYSPPKIDTIFLPTEKLTLPKPGNVAIISQSGGVLLDQFFLSFKERDIGVSSAVSIGNKAVINEVHLLEYFSGDDDTKVISFYIEGFEPMEGRAFLEASVKTGKDIVIYQGGKTERGKKAVSSHTASIASDYRIAHAAFGQYGIIQPQTEEEVLNYIKTYSVLASARRTTEIRDDMKGKVAIVTVSGGHGVVCLDLLEKYGLKPVTFEKYEMDVMKSAVNPTVAGIGSFTNPIDLTGAVSDDDIVKILDYLMQLDKIDIVICIVVPYPPKITMQIGRRIALAVRNYSKPLVCFVPYIEKYDLIRLSLELYDIPVAHTVSETVQMAAAIRDKSRAILRLRKRSANGLI